jgi:hypothetical protein
MTASLPDALASVLTAMERNRLRYVLYGGDPESDHELVILVEGPNDVAFIEGVLRGTGAEPVPHGKGHDFALPSVAPDESAESYVVQLRSGPGTPTTMANLLWIAATERGARAARESLEPRA